ncbi:XkdX family protein [Clostridium sp. OS1-26]|nr:XkdX family protein [Clostridium sp. OS1-26]WML35935.1 XkdX family protein [Clostridium sp. OS1-26]
MNWFDIISNYYKAGYYIPAQVAVFVAKEKITFDQHQQITGQVYTEQ